jgi:hypothetical protein
MHATHLMTLEYEETSLTVVDHDTPLDIDQDDGVLQAPNLHRRESLVGSQIHEVNEAIVEVGEDEGGGESRIAREAVVPEVLS